MTNAIIGLENHFLDFFFSGRLRRVLLYVYKYQNLMYWSISVKSLSLHNHVKIYRPPDKTVLRIYPHQLTKTYIVYNEEDLLSAQHKQNGILTNDQGAQWLSGRVLDSRPGGRVLKPHWRHCVVFLSKTHCS